MITVALSHNVKRYGQMRDDRLNANHESDRYKEHAGWSSLKLARCIILIALLASVTVTAVILTQPLIAKLIANELLFNARVTNTSTESILQLQMAASLESDKVISCYYNTPSQYSAKQLLPSDIHPNICTHINIAFARVHNKEIKLDEEQYKVLPDIVKLKQKNPDLKIILSIGGSGNDSGFSSMVADHASRKIFIKSIKYILRNYTLDGIDLDWEFPAWQGSYEGGSRERQHFSQLLREIRAEYIREKQNYLLTVAVAAPETIVDISYDVDQLNLYVDFVNVMSYDYHYYTKYTPFTGFNSPLYAKKHEQSFLGTLNINYTIQMYINKGLSRDKIVLGIPTYGHTFTLVNADNFKVASPASGFGSQGSLGFINYPDICIFLEKCKNNVSIVQDDEAKVPYLYREHEWVSYDTPESVIIKANFIKDNRLRGAMIYSLNADDYEGVCESTRGDRQRQPFPLSQTIRNTLFKNYEKLILSAPSN